MISLRRPLLLVLFIVVLLLAWQLRPLAMLVFGAVVIAAVIDAVADFLRRRLRVPARFSVASAVVLVLALLAALSWLAGGAIAEQSEQVRQRLPQALETLRRWLSSNSLGLLLLGYWQDLQDGQQLPLHRLAKLAGLTLEALAGALLLVVLALYLASGPKPYVDGLVRLVPRASRGKVRPALLAAGAGLRRWLKGQSISMLVIGAATALGLWIVGMEQALLLGLVAGLFAFVPVFGAAAAGLLAVLVAFVDGPRMALYVAIVFLVIQQLEEYFVTPFLQRWAVHLPPVLGLVATVAFGALFGPLGVVFATPLMVVVMILVRELYVEEVADRPAGETGA